MIFLAIQFPSLATKSNSSYMNRPLRLLIIPAVLALFTTACKKQSGEAPSNGIVETKPPVLTAVYKSIDGDIGGYWIALPALYDSTNKKYPVLLWFHGLGQVGGGNSTDMPNVLTESIPKLLKAGTFPPSFTVNGKNFSFIILAPQFRTTAT